MNTTKRVYQITDEQLQNLVKGVFRQGEIFAQPGPNLKTHNDKIIELTDELRTQLNTESIK